MSLFYTALFEVGSLFLLFTNLFQTRGHHVKLPSLHSANSYENKKENAQKKFWKNPQFKKTKQKNCTAGKKCKGSDGEQRPRG